MRADLEKYPEEEWGEVGSKERRWKLQKHNWLSNLYGLTFQAYEDMHEAQGGVCAICKKPETGIHVRESGIRKMSL